jgi:succinate dehydrogenase/fumarate reductase flavoprotein subunit
MSAFDVVVVGYGYAGAAAAIAACDAGAKVLLLERMPTPGGISICSAGGVRIAEDADAAFAYLRATNAGKTPDPVLRALADGMTRLPERIEALGRASGALISRRASPANYLWTRELTLEFELRGHLVTTSLEDDPGFVTVTAGLLLMFDAD